MDTINLGSVNIPTDKKADIIQAMCDTYGYTNTIDEVNPETSEVTQAPNPQTKAQFFKKQITKYIKTTYRDWKVTKASELLQQAAQEADAVDMN